MVRLTAIGTTALLVLLVCGAIHQHAGAAQAASEMALVYHSRIPLGTEVLTVTGWKVPISIMALAMNPQFEGWRKQTVGGRADLLDSGGAPVRYFPPQIDFRVTVSTRRKVESDATLFPLRTALAAHDYLLKLGFQLKIFHGLQQTVIQPQAVELIGVPAEIAYPDRTYLVSFALPQVPTRDRIVLEVLSPEGNRVCKFHLDLD